MVAQDLGRPSFKLQPLSIPVRPKYATWDPWNSPLKLLLPPPTAPNFRNSHAGRNDKSTRNDQTRTIDCDGPLFGSILIPSDSFVFLPSLRDVSMRLVMPPVEQPLLLLPWPLQLPLLAAAGAAVASTATMGNGCSYCSSSGGGGEVTS